MSEYDSFKKAKRDYWDEQINSLSAEIDSDDWSEEESIGLYLDIASKMAEEGVYRPRKYDSAHLLEALLITRNELNRLDDEVISTTDVVYFLVMRDGMWKVKGGFVDGNLTLGRD